MLVWMGRSGINSWEPLRMFALKQWWENNFRRQELKRAFGRA